MGYSEKTVGTDGDEILLFCPCARYSDWRRLRKCDSFQISGFRGKSFKLSVLKEGDYVRSFGYVKVAKEGKEFYFATTHLDHKYEDAARLKQVDEILACVEQLDKPVILGGDLNSRRGSATMAAFQKYFTVNCLSDGAPWTVPVPSPAYACDWLIYAPNEAFTVKAYNVCYWADKESDHYPVVATYLIK